MTTYHYTTPSGKRGSVDISRTIEQLRRTKRQQRPRLARRGFRFEGLKRGK